MPNHDIIVVGTSSGGVDALRQLVAGLPRDLPAALFVVLHRPPDQPSLLAEILDGAGPLPAENAVDGEPIVPGRIYVAPPDRHLLLEQDHVRLATGHKENRFRPAVDPLFRSAAYSYGARVIGVVLTGNLDDGTAGLWAIKDRGGIAIVQDPEEAPFPSMPRTAMSQVDVDYCLPMREIAPTLVALSARPAEGGTDVSERIEIETRIALEDNALEVGVMKLGTLSPFTCPECHGILLRIEDGELVRFRCHTGHAYSINSLLEDVNESVEISLWNALRAMDEHLLVLHQLADYLGRQNDTTTAAQIEQQAQDVRQRSQALRQVLRQRDQPSQDRPREPGERS